MGRESQLQGYRGRGTRPFFSLSAEFELKAFICNILRANYCSIPRTKVLVGAIHSAQKAAEMAGQGDDEDGYGFESQPKSREGIFLLALR
jgi:hypothetical protein